MDAVQAYFTGHSFVPQLGTGLILGTSGVKNPAFYKDLVGAVGIESNEKLYLKDLPGMHW
jgi:hypothetical protein